MCSTCGCSDSETRVIDFGHHGRTVLLEQKVLARNDELAELNRHRLAGLNRPRGQSDELARLRQDDLLVRTVTELAGQVSVVEGDQETVFDADRIRATGCPVVQVNTGAGCHLDATMVASALDALDPPVGSVVFVENVGNLVCPALFDLGETVRVVVMSVTEGVDKPLKYPHMFRAADLVVLNKTDLLPYVDFPVDVFAEGLASVNPKAEVLRMSAARGDGVEEWYSWLRSAR